MPASTLEWIFLRRVVAGSIDVIILILMGGFTFSQAYDYARSIHSDIPLMVGLWIAFLWPIPYTFVEAVGGITLGKLVLRIRINGIDGHSASLIQLILRWSLKMLPIYVMSVMVLYMPGTPAIVWITVGVGLLACGMSPLPIYGARRAAIYDLIADTVTMSVASDPTNLSLRGFEPLMGAELRRR